MEVPRRSNPGASWPSSRSALRLATLVVRLTFSGATPEGELSDSAVPFELLRLVCVVASLDLPRINVPPVAATAVPDIAMNRAR
jgi:hypothetical protein